MQIEQAQWSASSEWTPHAPAPLPDAQLVLLFGERSLLEADTLVETARAAYPGAEIHGCSTAGEICGTQVSDDSVVVTAIRFESSWVKSAAVLRSEVATSADVGALLASRLPTDSLVHMFVLSDGLSVNGSELVAGLTRHLPPH